ncbi:glycosyltransferase [Candidatus Saccharibacteria bacterium]|nr:glycosyltransferase [Candidatus Saccharibacteria bacterium]
MKKAPKVALVCDWLVSVGGAEKVLLKLHQLYPDAPIYTSKYDEKGIDWFKDADVRTGSLQKYPNSMRKLLGPLRQRYFSNLDLSAYDLVISVTGAEAKAVKAKNGLHISYCHVPTQYYWQMYKDYIKNPGFGPLNFLVRFFFRLMIRPLRKADLKAAQHPDYYITISEYARELIKKYYGRDAIIIHPPVETHDFGRIRKDCSDSSFITTSRQVNWKRIDLAVKACLMTQRPLLVIGDGPEHKKLTKLAKDSGLVTFLPTEDKTALAKHLQQARGYLFPSMEPFGIAPVEALAAGCPVIAYKKGGALDYVQEGKNGIFFEHQTAKSLAEAILKFDKTTFNRENVKKSAEPFSEARFETDLKKFIKQCEEEHAKKIQKTK